MQGIVTTISVAGMDLDVYQSPMYGEAERQALLLHAKPEFFDTQDKEAILEQATLEQTDLSE